MKVVRFFLAVLLACNLFGLSAQNGIEPFSIKVNDRKFMFMRFPSEVKYVDMGSEDLYAELVMGKILKLKAQIPYFEKTNLSVVTTSGKYYSYVVSYDAAPPVLAIDMSGVQGAITDDNIIRHTEIKVSDMHTSHIIMPCPIQDIAVGFDNIISEQAQEIDNIVKVKSLLGEGEEFFQTSITVTTKDGGIYPMLVDYEKNPEKLNISFKRDADNAAMFSGVNANDEQMKKMAEWIVAQGQKINDIGMEEHKMTFQLNGVYTDQDVMAFYLSAKNRSKINYSVDFIRAYIRDKKTTKKTAVQEEEIFPIYTYYSDERKVITGKGKLDVVLFYKKFTIPQKRMLYFEMFESNGGRQIRFSASYKVLISANIIENLNKQK